MNYQPTTGKDKAANKRRSQVVENVGLMIDNCSTILLKAAEKEMTDSWKGQMVKYLRFHFNLLCFIAKHL